MYPLQATGASHVHPSSIPPGETWDPHPSQPRLQKSSLVTMHDLLQQWDLRYQVGLAILDFSKAFDTVPLKRLLGILEMYRISGKAHTWISSFLTGRKQSVVVDRAHSPEKDVLSGVPQGTVLEPLLFLPHINDIVAAIDPETKCRLFADDCLLYPWSCQERIMTNSSVTSANWNVGQQTGACTSTQQRVMWWPFVETTHRAVTCTILQSVSHEKYLGVLISDDLSWSPHTQRVSTAANQKFGFVKRNLKDSPRDLNELAYITTTSWVHHNCVSTLLSKNMSPVGKGWEMIITLWSLCDTQNLPYLITFINIKALKLIK